MMKTYLIILLFLTAFTTVAQNNEELIWYYPDQCYYPVEINVEVHVMQFSQNEPKNFTPKDSGQIHDIFDRINQMYNNFSPPTLKVADVPYFNESKIKFHIQKISFHVDSVGWKVDWIEGLKPIDILSCDMEKGMVKLKGYQKNYLDFKLGFYLLQNDGKKMKFLPDSCNVINDITTIKFKPNKVITAPVKLGFYQLKSKNCNQDNYTKYGKSNRVMHVFLTQATTTNIVFGCGPSKNFLNVANTYKSDIWVAAQLVAHELGHTLGLSHTDYPQFADLPKKDKFGWLPCDSIEVSNNIMGYNVCRSYLSPMQIGSVHRLYNTREDYIALTTNFNYDENMSIKINSNLELNRNLMFSGDIIVKKNKKLIIKKITYLTPQAKIYIEDNASIVIDGGSISVIGHQKNENIVFCRKVGSMKKPKKKGKIETINGGKIVGLVNYE